MMVKVTGSEWNRFYADAEAWPEGAWHEDEEITIDGNAPTEDFDIADVADSTVMTVSGGVVYLHDEEVASLEAYFKRWRKRQTTTVLVVEVPHEGAAAFRAAISAAGGKVRA